MHNCTMVMDFQYGSTGKGLIAGYLAKREKYDTVICAFATNAGHTYIDKSRDIHVMTQQLPTAITSPTVKNILIGPGAAIHLQTLLEECARYARFLDGKRLVIHPHAAIVRDEHAEFEKSDGRTKMGSTAKGVGEAYIERIRRNPETANIMGNLKPGDMFHRHVTTVEGYDAILRNAESVLIEGAQGFGLSMYHGQYPYVTSRDVTPWQIAADCGLPFKWAPYVNIVGTLRTLPIRVNNRDGYSGPCYPDQRELSWHEVGVASELTTVTKLPRRIFTFSHQQLQHAMMHCGQYWKTKLFLNFANYLSRSEVDDLICNIELPTLDIPNPPKVCWIGNGPDDADVELRGL